MEKSTLPNSTASLVLGILSIITCCCYGIIGLPMGIIAIVLGNKAIKIFNENPEIYSKISNAKTGKILGIIGVIFNLIFLIYIIWFIYMIGWAAMQDPQLLQEKLLDLQ